MERHRAAGRGPLAGKHPSEAPGLLGPTCGMLRAADWERLGSACGMPAPRQHLACAVPVLCDVSTTIKLGRHSSCSTCPCGAGASALPPLDATAPAPRSPPLTDAALPLLPLPPPPRLLCW